MTAILGIFHPNSDIDFKEIIENGFATISHRGSEAIGYYHNRDISLATNNLLAGDSPIKYLDDRYILICSGSIYNIKEIKELLINDGYQFETDDDSEVLLALYLKEGANFLQRLRGYYSIIIWDEVEKEIFAARDNFGISPFYYEEVQEGENKYLYFASEKKALLAMKNNHQIERTSVQDYFSYRFVPEPRTMHENINRLLPGHYFTSGIEKPMEINSYWKPIFKNLKQSEEKILKDIKEALYDSVGVCMNEGEIGCLLSSGVDSTIIAAIAKEYKPDIKTYTVYFDQGYSELEIAEKTAETFKLDNTPVKITAEEYMEVFPKMVYHLDDPLSDESAIGLYFVSRAAKNDVGVLLSGEGSDELFSGYKLYKEPIDLRLFKYIPKAIRKSSYSLLAGTNLDFKGKNSIMRGLQDINERHFSNTRAFQSLDSVKLLLKNFNENQLPIHIAQKYYREIGDIHDISKMQYIDLNIWATGDILLKADRMNMANGMEVRMPFLDKKVFEVASKIDPRLNIRNQTTKYMLREAMRGIVPQHVINRPKLGFPVPLGQWLKNEMHDWAMEIIKDSDVDEFIDKSFVYKLYDEHLMGKRDNRKEIWACITFMLWYQIFIQE